VSASIVGGMASLSRPHKGPPRLTINRDGRLNRAASVNAY
jgi:hypothetical protein